jgi:hypothetical protein
MSGGPGRRQDGRGLEEVRGAGLGGGQGGHVVCVGMGWWVEFSYGVGTAGKIRGGGHPAARGAVSAGPFLAGRF